MATPIRARRAPASWRPSPPGKRHTRQPAFPTTWCCTSRKTPRTRSARPRWRSPWTGSFAGFAPELRHNACMRIALALVLIAPAAFAADSAWTAYGGNPGGTRYAALKQVTRENVAKLRPAWTYHTGALNPETRLNEKAAFEATPILVEGTLYLSTPFNRVIALDPATGAERWTYDPQVDRTHDYSEVTS